MIGLKDDNYFMGLALDEARKAYDSDEVPIGAIVVLDDEVVGRGHNQTEALGDVTAHAEMLAITAAQNYLGAKTLEQCTLYVTVEPCVMCAGALRWSRPRRIVWGASEPKVGYTTFSDKILHPKSQCQSGIREEECRALMQRFFKSKRR